MMEYIIHNLFSTDAGVVWLVLKWALVVLAAGFIGQFGKAFAAYLIRRAGKGKEKSARPDTGQDAPPPAVKVEAAPGAAVRDAGPVTGTAPAALSGQDEAALLREVQEAERKTREKQEKKARKEHEKVRKKMLKGIHKLFK